MGNKYVLSVDQGTTSTRAMLVDHSGSAIAIAQKEHSQIFPKAGWVEHDPIEILINTRKVISELLAIQDINKSDIVSVGICNQRETVVLWDKRSGKPVYNAIVWQDIRTDKICDEISGGNIEKYKKITGLPIATYFSATKIKWILNEYPDIRKEVDNGNVICGTMDSWLIWNLTDKVHVIDCTNASRMLLMNLKTLEWDKSICNDIGIPIKMLPRIVSSSEVYGHISSNQILAGIPVAGAIGDQQGAMFGQACLSVGDSKNTYGTGNFILVNTGKDLIFSQDGLLTTVCYKTEKGEPIYALEGSIAVTGSAIQWLRDNLGIIKHASETEKMAKSIESNENVYFVPAFSGLFAPYWRVDARGLIVGMTRYSNKNHIVRAALEATAYQSRDIIDVIVKKHNIAIKTLKVDGGMVSNNFLMQFQADLLNRPVIKPKVAETTGLGGAYVAGLAVGFWSDIEDIKENWLIDKVWKSNENSETEKYYQKWKKAVLKSYDWA